MPSSSPLERPSVNANTRRAVDADDATACAPRSPSSAACHCSSPQSSACRPPTAAPPTGARGRRASNTPPCDVPPSAIRSTHGRADRRARGGALVEEHVDRAAARRERLGRDDRREDRDPRCTRASARPTCRCRACASAAAGTCRAAASATPAASPPARAACRTGVRRLARRSQLNGLVRLVAATDRHAQH